MKQYYYTYKLFKFSFNLPYINAKIKIENAPNYIDVDPK